MEDKTTILESLIDSAENYGKSSIELWKLQAIKKLAETISTIASSIIVIFISVLFILILSIGLSLWIGDYLGKSYLGFFIVSGIYLLIAIICMAGKKQLLKTPVSNAIIKNIMN
jgi:hypothetical protein